MQTFLVLLNTGALCVMLGVSARAQTMPRAPASAATAPARIGFYVDATPLKLFPLLPGPPAQDSLATAAELLELHRIEGARTATETAAAVADDLEEDIFSFRVVFGDWFRADRLPVTAAFSAHVHGEEGVVSAGLKQAFDRPRPYQVDKTLHPVCKLTAAHNSYPSGHTLSGYLLAFTLAEMIPEKKQQILARADEYAHNRLVCGVHYASDLEASRRTAYVLFGSMMTNPKFLQDMQAARTEIRAQPGWNVAAR